MKAIPRTAPRSRKGPALLAGLVGACAILGVLAPSGGTSPGADAPPPGPRRIGMNSCAARGCHGAVEGVDPSKGDVYVKDGAYTTWLNLDPHARAFDVLKEPRSERMAGLLKDQLGNKPAHEAALCLSCHSTVEPPAPVGPKAIRPRDGISCEACHGPAEVWNDKHLDIRWRDQPAGAKRLDGLTDLSTPGARAETCVTCHVGDRSRGMDMNHDLIAAGHPRLNFEFASYQAAYPKHWRERHEKARPAGPVDFEAKSWAIGQVVTAQAVLRLLAARAGASKPDFKRVAPAPEGVWPEFSEYECFACHHGLVKPSPFQTDGHVQGKPGLIPWATWPSAMLPGLAKGRRGLDLDSADSPWAGLRAEMSKLIPDPDKVADLAGRSVKQLDALRAALEREEFDARRLASLMKDLAARPPSPERGWDRQAQHALALMALARAYRDLGVKLEPDAEKALEAASKLLQFPPNYDSPRNVSKAPAAESKP